jgi:transaldolase
VGVYLDSAHPGDAQRAQQLGFVEAITTNPTLIARTGRPRLEVLAELVEIFDGHVFYQVTAPSVEGRYDQAWEAHEVRPDKVVIKIPAFVIPYVNRITRQLGDGLAVVRDVAQILRGTQTEVLAAGLKTVDEVVATLLAGAQHVTIPLELILAMGEHELSRQAIEEFNAGV